LISSENQGLSIANFALDHALGLAQRQDSGEESAEIVRLSAATSVLSLGRDIANLVQILAPGGY
jgi:hypothetical protein